MFEAKTNKTLVFFAPPDPPGALQSNPGSPGALVPLEKDPAPGAEAFSGAESIHENVDR